MQIERNSNSDTSNKRHLKASLALTILRYESQFFITQRYDTVQFLTKSKRYLCYVTKYLELTCRTMEIVKIQWFYHGLIDLNCIRKQNHIKAKVTFPTPLIKVFQFKHTYHSSFLYAVK